MKYEYDASGVYFSYFVLALLGLFLLPTTLGYGQRLWCSWRGIDRYATGGASAICLSEAAVRKRQLREAKTRRTLRHPRISKTFVAWFLGWVVFGGLCYLISVVEVEPAATLYDPYAILNITASSNEEEIRKVYKRLSLKWHPDKNPEDPEAANEVFVKVSKAYQSLTDPAVRENYEKYGNPDGKQTFTFGIALPAWVVEPSNMMLVLGVYAALFGFLLPLIVARWWSGSKKYSKDRVLNYTMSILFKEMKETMNARRMLELLCASMELKEDVPDRGKRDVDAVLELFRAVKDVVYEKTGERLELPKTYNGRAVSGAISLKDQSPYCYKAFTIIHAHLFRVPIKDALLCEDSFTIIPAFVHLATKGLLQITSAHYWLQQSLHCIDISRMIIQAVPAAWNHLESSELMQLPHFNAVLVKHLRNRKKPVKSIAQFMTTLSIADREEMLRAGGLEQQQVHDVMLVAREYPVVTIDRAYFECAGEDVITPESLVTFVLKLKAVNHVGETADNQRPLVTSATGSAVTSPNVSKKTLNVTVDKTDSATPASDSDDEEEESFGDDGEPKRSSKLTKLLTGAYWNNPNRPVYCPFYPEFPSDEAGGKRPVYLAWLSNPRNNRVVGMPLRINDLVPRALAGEGATEKGTRVVRFRFQAPPQAGTFQFTVVVACDSYVGMELRQDVRMVVRDVSKDDQEQHELQVQESWRDFEEEERLERELGLSSGLGGSAATALANARGGAMTGNASVPSGGDPGDSADDTSTSDSDLNSDDDAHED